MGGWVEKSDSYLSCTHDTPPMGVKSRGVILAGTLLGTLYCKMEAEALVTKDKTVGTVICANSCTRLLFGDVFVTMNGSSSW